MNIDLERSFKYVVQDREWIKKAGPVLGLNVIVSIISLALSFFGEFGAAAVGESGGSEEAQILAEMLPALTQIGVWILLFPITIYMFGYLYEITKNTMLGVEPEMPYHGEFMARFKTAIGIFLANLGASLIGWVFFIAGFILIMIGITQIPGGGGEMTDIQSITAASTFIPALFLFGLGLVYYIIVGLVVMPAQRMIYLATNSVSAAYNLTQLKEVIRAGWTKFILLYALQMAIGVGVISLVYFSVCCFGIGFLLFPIVEPYMQLVFRHLEGQLYQELLGEVRMEIA